MNFINDTIIITRSAAFDKDFYDDFYMGPHFHPRYELMYNAQGSFDILIFSDEQDGTPQHFTIPPRSYIILKPNVIHQLIIPPKMHSRIVNIELYLCDSSKATLDELAIHINLQTLLLFSQGLKKFLDDPKRFCILNDNGNFLQKLRAYVSFQSQEINNHEIKIQQHLATYDLILEFSKCVSQKISSYGILYVKSAISYIEKYYASDISVEDIAKASGVSKYYLQKLFKKYTKKTINETLTASRIEHCKNLLVNTNMKVNDLYKIVGFSNRQSLLYEFKKLTGLSPSEYRDKHVTPTIDIAPTETEGKATIEVKNIY